LLQAVDCAALLLCVHTNTLKPILYSKAIALTLNRSSRSQRLLHCNTVNAATPLQGDNFYAAYTALLRDTGRMTAEELVQKHLGVSIEDPEFWRGSARIIEAKIDALEAVMVELGL
jgi:oligoendopeptidase F